MRLIITLLIIPILFVSACKKADKPAVIEVTVRLQNQTTQANVNVSLLNVTPNIGVIATIGTSTSSGRIDYPVSPGKTYYLYYDGTNQETIANSNVTYIVTGKFTNQQQIDSSPSQGANTKVGDDIYMDINGDGKIDDNDKVVQVTEPSDGGTTNVDLILSANNML